MKLNKVLCDVALFGYFMTTFVLCTVLFQADCYFLIIVLFSFDIRR